MNCLSDLDRATNAFCALAKLKSILSEGDRIIHVYHSNVNLYVIVMNGAWDIRRYVILLDGRDPMLYAMKCLDMGLINPMDFRELR